MASVLPFDKAGACRVGLIGEMGLVVIASSVRFASPVRFHQLVKWLGQVSEDAGSSLKLFVEHPAGLPVHGAT